MRGQLRWPIGGINQTVRVLSIEPLCGHIQTYNPCHHNSTTGDCTSWGRRHQFRSRFFGRRNPTTIANDTEGPSALMPPTGQLSTSALTTPPRKAPSKISSSSSRFYRGKRNIITPGPLCGCYLPPSRTKPEGWYRSRAPGTTPVYWLSCRILRHRLRRGVVGDLITATQAKANGGRFWM